MISKKSSGLSRLAAALLALILTLTLLGSALAETYAIVSGTKSLNLRSNASSSSQWLGAYAQGSWVTVTGSKNNFYRVYTPDGQTGYMSKNFLKTTDQLTYANVAIVSNSKSTAFLNLRAYPSYSANVLALLYNGVPLNILSTQNGWYYVQMGNTLGYVRSEFTNVQYQPVGIAVATIKTPNNTSVNMRVSPSSSSSIRRQFAGDRYVSVIYAGTGWWYVCIDGYLGFISSDFLAEGLHAARDNAAQQEGDSGSYAIVNNPVSTQTLNLRELPSTASAVVSQLGNGQKLSVLVQGTEWCRVYVDSIAATGYVMTRYLKLYHLPTTPTLTIQHPQGSYVNLRSEASMAYASLARVPDGSTATILAPGPDWTKVRYQGLTGYVMNYFTSIANVQ